MSNEELRDRLLHEMDGAERKAWDALSRYKFYMFGYWAAAWVKFNHIGGFKRPNPFREAVDIGRRRASEHHTPTA